MAITSPNYTEILDAKGHFHELQYQHWLQYELFTYQWWTLLGVLIISWLIWWKFVDKTRTAIILSYGFFIMFVVIALDAMGIVYELWIYPIQLLPIIPHAIPLDWGLFPVLNMLIYQYFPRWRSFILAETISAAFLSFIGEPLAEWLGTYCALHWYSTWSFPIYVLIAAIGKVLIERLFYPVK